MKSLLVLSGTASLAAAICSHGTTLFPRDSPAPISTFGYDGVTGPLGWYGLDPVHNAACALGRHQSPINIVTGHSFGAGTELNFTFEDYPDGAVLENLGTTLEVVANGSMTLPQAPPRTRPFHPNGTQDPGSYNKQYELKQFHFHAPSEHHFDGKDYPMEVHFVFQAADASLSVIAFVIEISYFQNYSLYPSWIDSIFEDVEDVATPGSVGRTGPFTFYDTGLHRLLEESSFYRYSGSLTTPPCTEGVTWSVLDTPLFLNPETYYKVKQVMGFNSRYTQNAPGEINLLDAARRQLDQAHGPIPRDSNEAVMN